MSARTWYAVDKVDPVPLNERVAAPAMRAIATLNGELIHAARLKARLSRVYSAIPPETPREDRMVAWNRLDVVTREVHGLESSIKQLLDSFTMHELEWTHMSEDCSICLGEVTFR